MAASSFCDVTFPPSSSVFSLFPTVLFFQGDKSLHKWRINNRIFSLLNMDLTSLISYSSDDFRPQRAKHGTLRLDGDKLLVKLLQCFLSTTIILP